MFHCRARGPTQGGLSCTLTYPTDLLGTIETTNSVNSLAIPLNNKKVRYDSNDTQIFTTCFAYYIRKVTHLRLVMRLVIPKEIVGPYMKMNTNISSLPVPIPLTPIYLITRVYPHLHLFKSVFPTVQSVSLRVRTGRTTAHSPSF